MRFENEEERLRYIHLKEMEREQEREMELERTRRHEEERVMREMEEIEERERMEREQLFFYEDNNRDGYDDDGFWGMGW